MVQKVNGAGGAESLKSKTFQANVNEEKAKIKANSVWANSEQMNQTTEGYLEEVAFLKEIYDKDESENITPEELDEVSCYEFDAKRQEYDPNGTKLILTSCEDVEAELRRNIEGDKSFSPEQLREFGIVAIRQTAATSENDITEGSNYKNLLLEIKKLNKEPDNPINKAFLSSDKSEIEALDLLMSPEARGRIKKEIGE